MEDEGKLIEQGTVERKHVTFLLHKLPLDKYEEFKDFCHRVAGGNYATGLSFLLELAKVNRGIDVLLRLVHDIELRLGKIENKDEEEPEEVEREVPKTLGGEDE